MADPARRLTTLMAAPLTLEEKNARAQRMKETLKKRDPVASYKVERKIEHSWWDAIMMWGFVGLFMGLAGLAMGLMGSLYFLAFWGIFKLVTGT